MIIKDVETPEN